MEENKLIPDKQEVDLIELLLTRQAELNALLEITQAINNNTSTSVLFEMLEMVMKNNLKVGKFRLLVKDEQFFICLCKFGGLFEHHHDFQLISEEILDITIPTKLAEHPYEALSCYDYFIPVYHKNNLLAYVLVGDFQTLDQLLSNQIDYIQTLINVIVVALENKKLFKERIQRERLQREIELASQVQNMLIPHKLQKNETYDVESTYLPHQNIGGDFFDFIELDNNEVLWCIADVSGKGISAALIMANFQASLRALAFVETELSNLIKKLNKVVFRNTNGERFITVFLGKYNKTTRKINYINAGHNPSLLFQNEQTCELKNGTVMIGVFDELPFVNEGIIDVEKNAFIFNYTDGVTEYDGEEDMALTEESLLEFLKLHKDKDLKEIHEVLILEMNKLKNNLSSTDDITMLSLRFY